MFTLEDLRNATVVSYLDNVNRAGGHQKEKHITDVYLYFYEREAKEHFDRVHLLVELERIPEACSEYRLITRYYKPWMDGTDTVFPDRISTRLDFADPQDPAKFTSPVMNWLMVSHFSQGCSLVYVDCRHLYSDTGCHYSIPVVVIHFNFC